MSQSCRRVGTRPKAERLAKRAEKRLDAETRKLYDAQLACEARWEGGDEDDYPLWVSIDEVRDRALGVSDDGWRGPSSSRHPDPSVTVRCRPSKGSK